MITLEHDGRRLHYLAMMRTGSKATAQALRDMGAEQIGRHHDGPQPGWIKEGEPVLTAVRNHYDLFASLYWRNARHLMSLDELVRQVVETLRPLVSPPPGGLFDHFQQWATITLRYETIEADFAEAMTSSGFPAPKLERLPDEPGRDVHYRDIITPPVRQYIEDRYGEEMQWLGYSWDD